jgi:hypothetical protein
LDERWVFGWVVLKVGVLDEHDLARRLAKPLAQCRAFAAVFGVEHDLEAGPVDVLMKDLARPVGRPVVDEDDLFVDLDGFDALDERLERRSFGALRPASARFEDPISQRQATAASSARSVSSAEPSRGFAVGAQPGGASPRTGAQAR